MAKSWKKIKREYITGDASYRTLAGRHGVSLSTLSKTAQKEGWAEARQKYRDKLEVKTTEAMCARACAREVKRLEKLQKAAERTVDILSGILEDQDQFRRHLVIKSVSGVGSSVEQKEFDKYDMRAIKDYAAALQTMTATVRNLYGLMTTQEDEALDIARRRLAVDERKAQAGEMDDEETGVVMIPEQAAPQLPPEPPPVAAPTDRAENENAK